MSFVSSKSDLYPTHVIVISHIAVLVANNGISNTIVLEIPLFAPKTVIYDILLS